MSTWFYPRGTLARPDWESVVDDTLDGWQHTGLRIGELAGGAAASLPAAGVERLVVPLSGSFSVDYRVDGGVDGGAHHQDLRGRDSVFDGPTDVLYLPTGAAAEVTGDGRFAVAAAPTSMTKPARYLERSAVPVELRGAGPMSRQVHNFGTPDALDAARFIVCEVITPAGGWSSYPPHKHDTAVPGVESRLEEIYYFETAVIAGHPAPDTADPIAHFATYASDERPIAIDATVRTGDIALVPYGYHGPAAAAPGYDLYYLNVMAGPDPERMWNITDDPAHSWVRELWEGDEPDRRLPFGTREDRR